MRKIVLLLVCVFFLASASAMTWDNVKEIDENIVTIKDNLGLGSDLVKVELIDNTDFCLTECYAIWNVTIYDDEDDFVDLIEFYDKENLERSLNYKFEYISSYSQETIKLYENICSLDEKSINGSNICYEEETGEEIRYYPNWNNFNAERKITPGNYIIKLIGYKEKFMDIDWKPTFYGEKIDEWDWWQGTQPSVYWKLNEASGDAADSSASITATNTGGVTFSSGKLNNSAYFANETLPYFDAGDPFNLSSIDFTIAAWFKHNATFVGNAHILLGKANSLFGNGDWAVFIGTDGYIQFQGADTGGNSIILEYNNATVISDTWQRIVVTRDGDTTTDALKIYINGSLMNETDLNSAYDISTPDALKIAAAGAANGYTGYLDDIQMYNITWSSTDVSDDWNNGAGREGDEFPISSSVTLGYPANDYSTIDTTLGFNATFIATGGNLTNATLYVWNSDKSLFDSNITTNINGTSNSSNLSISSLSFGDGYTWNFYACVSNSSGGTSCEMATSNRTFNRRGFIIDNQAYNNNVYETANERFEANITTIEGILSVNAKLNYNNTKHTATTICNSVTNTCNLRADIDIPVATLGENENKSFKWEITSYDGSSFTQANSSSYEQNVSRIYLTGCNASYTVTSYNFTAADEQNLSSLEDFNFDATFTYFLGTGSSIRNTSLSVNVTEQRICILPNDKNYVTYANIEYSNGNNSLWTPRNYYFQNDSFTNSTQNITLYLLKSNSITTFILEVQDENLIEVPNALIEIQKYYPGENIYRIVQIAKTDDNGESVGFFETETIDYKFVITKNNTKLLETAKQKIIGKEAPYTLTFTIGGEIESPLQNFTDIPSFYANLTYNSTTQVVTYTYIDELDTFEYGRLFVSLQNFSGYDFTICNSNSTQSSATLTCNVSNYTRGTFIAQGYLKRSGESLVKSIGFVIRTALDILDKTGAIVGWFIILTAMMVGIWNPSTGIIITDISIILVNLIGLLSFSLTFIFGIIGVSIILLILLKT